MHASAATQAAVVRFLTQCSTVETSFLLFEASVVLKLKVHLSHLGASTPPPPPMLGIAQGSDSEGWHQD